MNVYISLPVTGRPLPEAVNHADTVKTALSKQGHRVTTPFDVFAGANPGWEDYITADVNVAMTSDTVYFCDGWERSPGCRLEMNAVTEVNNHRIAVGEGGKLINVVFETPERKWR